MSRTPFIVACSLSLVLYMPSLAAEPRRVGIEAGPGLEAIVREIQAEHPLPGDWLWAEVGGTREDAGLILQWEDGSTIGAGAGKVILERRWLAAAVDFLDPRYSVTRDEARDIGLEDLASIELPMRALAVDDLYPGDVDYPFIRSLTLGPRTASPLPPQLLHWLSSLSDIGGRPLNAALPPRRGGRYPGRPGRSPAFF